MLVIQLSYMEIVWEAFFLKKIFQSVFSVTSLLNCFQKPAEIVEFLISIDFRKCMKIVWQAFNP